MAKPIRKTLGSKDSPHIISLVRILQTQNKVTICNWCLNYAEQHILPVFSKHYPDDLRPQGALDAARDWLAGKLKLPAVKQIILYECHAAARELEGKHAAQAAARAIGQAAGCVHAPPHSLGLAFYGAAAVAYDSVGIDESAEVYEQFFAAECARMEAALLDTAIPNETNPAKCNWRVITG